jgi:transposase-like protein
MEQNSKPPRRRYTAAQRAELVGLFRKSNLTQREFALEHDINLGTFHRWVYGRKKPQAAAPSPVFQEVLLPAAAAPAWSAEISLGKELTVRLDCRAAADFVARLANHLPRPC